MASHGIGITDAGTYGTSSVDGSIEAAVGPSVQLLH